MAKKESSKRKKGTFSFTKLSVSRNYIFPNPRRAMMVIGGMVGLGILAFFVIDHLFLKSSLTASGPLSSFHAKFEKDCAACHEQFNAVTNAKCSICHEKTGDTLGVYTFAAHYVYRSADLRRVKPSEQEHPCYLCHQEHLGREAFITNVPDSRCTPCHAFGSFNKKHPQFEFATRRMPDDSTMLFTHIRHVKEVVKQEKLVDIERACLYCHNPQPDGKHFAPIEFDVHCSACHLTPNMETPPLKIKSFDDSLALGVETLDAIRRQRKPGTTWASYTNPNEFKTKPGNRLVKSPIYHEDPWIMENLKVMRRMLYSGGRGSNSDFPELLKTSGKVFAPNTSSFSAMIYQEAIQTLKDYSTGLRGRPEPEIQMDLAQIDSLLKITQKKLRRQPNAVVNPKLLMPSARLNANFTLAQAEAINAFVDDLTKPCRECHMVSNATILRVRKEQQILSRAEFNHRAHILQRRCLECHVEIPIVVKAGNGAAVPKFKDRSAIQNIPGIENCRACHNASETSNRCVTCHYFHPNKTNRSSMLLYLD